MKKKIVIAFGIIALCFGCFLILKISQKYNQNKAIALQKQTLPNFQLYDQNLDHFSGGQLKKATPVCIFYYNADCEHCQYEATQIKKNITAFNNTQILMVSVNKPEEVTKFAKTYNLDQYPHITWLYDKDYNFYKWFGNTPTPSVFIYNSQHKLLKEYKGEVKIELVLKHLKSGKES